MGEMTPAVERLVRLMVLLPDRQHPLREGLIADCGDITAVNTMRWFVGDAAAMWPPGGPVNLAGAVLTVFGASSESTLRLLSDVLVDGSGGGLRAGAAWVTHAIAAAVDVLAQHPSLDQVLQDVRERWTLRSGTS